MPKGEEWFTVEGVIVGWLKTADDGDLQQGAVEIFEGDVAIVQTEQGQAFIRWLGNDWQQIDPPPITSYQSGAESATVEQFAAIGTKIRFNTNYREQMDYTRMARGEEAE